MTASLRRSPNATIASSCRPTNGSAWVTLATTAVLSMAAPDQPPEWITYPDEGHGFSKREDLFDFARRLDAFLAKHLQP